MILSYPSAAGGKEKDVDEDLGGWGVVWCEEYEDRLGVGEKVMVSFHQSQGWRKRSYSFQNGRSLTPCASLLFPSLSTDLISLKDKLSLVNNTELGS